MAEIPSEDIRAHIIWKLHIKRMYGGKHTAIESVAKGVPKHLSGSYVGVAKQLIREGLVLPKTTGYGLHISLNPRKTEEILRITNDFATRHKKFFI